MPVVSDGVTPFMNEDMGISAVFSAGSRVCRARSGDAARGYYADYGFKGGTCSESSPVAEASIGVGSSYAPVDGPPLLLQSKDCKPPPAMLSQFSAWADDHFTAILGSEYLVCEDSDISGEVAITAHVYTPARIKGRPGTLYWASLRTQEHRIKKDLVRFRQFLSNLKLTGSQ